MKKLKVVLTLLLALCCSLCMFACGGGGGSKNISEIKLEGQKKNFQEGEPFSAEGLKVSVYYQGDDKLYELKAEDYEIDSSAYDADNAGEYIIYVIPKNQSKELWDGTAGSKDNRKKESYYVSVDHDWKESTDGDYQFECKCGAKKNNYTGLQDEISTVAWGNPATLKRGAEGKTYGNGVKEPISGENHVSYGTLIAGQSLKLTLQIKGLTRGGKIEAWDSPLMGIRNGADGILPREDGWIIGEAAGFKVPAECNVPVAGGGADRYASGTATKDSPLWEVHKDGTTWEAGVDFHDKDTDKWSTVVVEYIYQADGVMLMRHTLHRFDGSDPVSFTVTINLPKAAYEVVAYGEFCDYVVTDVEFVAGLAITGYTVDSQPTNLKQPEGKLFDTTGLKATATFSDGSTLGENNFNAYAYRDIVPEGGTEAVKTRVTLSVEPLKPDMYGFFIEFNGMTADLSEEIEVIPTPVTGANATAIKVDNVSFEAPDVAYDYAVTEDKTYIRLIATGAPIKATATQAEKLGGSTHFIAFKLLTTLAAADVAETFTVSPKNIVVKATKVGNTVDVVLGLKADYDKTFDLNLAEGKKVQIDLSGLTALPAVSAEIIATDFTIDAGGTYTVKYTGLEGTLSDYTLAVGNASDTVAEVKAAIGTNTYTAGATPTRDKFYRASNTLFIVKVDDTKTGELTVQYWLAAPDLGSLTSDRMSTAVSIRSGNTTLASASLIYNFASNATNIGTASDPIYASVSGKTLTVYAFKDTTDIKDGTNFVAALNVEHTVAENEQYVMSYNVGVTITKGAAAWLDENALTGGVSAPKFLAVGTVNDATDYDKGAILVASIDLSGIGVRAEDETAKFRFTANEDTVNGQNEYTIFAVDEKDKITSTTQSIPSTARETLSPADCLTDGTSAFQTEDGFYYGALILPASGAHKFGTPDATGAAVCSECHAVNRQFKVLDEAGEDTGYYYNVIDGVPGKDIKNSDEDSEWGSPWAAIGATKVSGDFVLHFSWDNARDNFLDNVIQMIDETGDAAVYGTIRPFGVNLAEWSDPLNKGLALQSVTVNGQDNKNDKDEFVIPEADTNAGFWLGHYDLSFYRMGGRLVMVGEFERGQGKECSGTADNGRSTLSGFQVPLTPLTGDAAYKLSIIYVIEEFTTNDITIQISGNPYWCDNYKYSFGTVTYDYGTTGSALNLALKPIVGAVENGITLNMWVDKMSGDWGTKIIETKTNMIVCLMNLDPYHNTTNGGFPTNLNGFPDWAENGGGIGTKCNEFSDMNEFYSNKYYLTVTVSVKDGVKYYKDGVLKIWYKPTAVFINGTVTVADFCEYVLGEIEKDGCTIFSGYAEGATADHLVVSAAMSDKQVTEHYAGIEK